MKEYKTNSVKCDLVPTRKMSLSALVVFLGGWFFNSTVDCKTIHPDIAYMPLSEFEPDHNHPAAEWRVPYCLEWQDKCSVCSRDTADAAISCHEKVDMKYTCEPKFAACVHFDPKIFDKYCKVYASHRISWNELYSGSAEDYLRGRVVRLYLNYWHKTRGHWEHISTQSGPAFPKFRLSIEALARTTGVYTCIKAYSIDEAR